MGHLVNETARIVGNEHVGPRLHLMKLVSPAIAKTIAPGQFIHMKVPGAEAHILRRPFSVYARDADAGTLDVLYQEVGSMTEYMPTIEGGTAELIGPVGNTWSPSGEHALIVGGGVGAAPLFMLTETLQNSNVCYDVVLGAQSKDALVCRERYALLMGREPLCATDDGSYGRAGFCTTIVEERLQQGCTQDGTPYDYVAVCGPPVLMKIVAGLAEQAGVRCEVSMEKRMACGVGACLSCVVDTVDGKRRSCVDGPVFDARKVVW